MFQNFNLDRKIIMKQFYQIWGLESIKIQNRRFLRPAKVEIDKDRKSNFALPQNLLLATLIGESVSTTQLCANAASAARGDDSPKQAAECKAQYEKDHSL